MATASGFVPLMGESMRKERRWRRSPSDEDNDGSGLRLLRRSLRRSGDGSSRRERRRSRSGGGGRSSDKDGGDHSDSGSDDRVGRRKGSYRDVTEEEIVEYMAKKARGNERLRISSTGFGITVG